MFFVIAVGVTLCWLIKTLSSGIREREVMMKIFNEKISWVELVVCGFTALGVVFTCWLIASILFLL
jgi:hypothetical protein